MSEIKVNKISPRTACGTTTLGDSGDTFTIPSGVTITNSGTATGFGRTGAVDWVTTVQTSTITVVDGKGYFVNTTSGGITANLPAGSAGKICAFKDYLNTWDNNALTVSPNGTDKIGGTAGDATFNTESQSVTLIYTDSTRGWIDIHDSTTSAQGSAYIAATGGTITTCGDYKIHTFTSPGTFCVSAGSGPLATTNYLVVAGGGGAKVAGGGGGGFRFYAAPDISTPYPASPLNAPAGVIVSPGAYPISVGGGGAGTCNAGNPSPVAARGGNSIFSTITSTGGGAGGGRTCGNATQQSSEDGVTPGGSGGGGYNTPGGSGPAPTGNTPPVSPSQGNNGGTSADQSVNSVGTGGGGGAMAVGANGSNGPGPAGGNAGNGGDGGGVPTAFGSNGVPCGSFRYYAGGGGGGAQKDSVSAEDAGAGGKGGGGTGKKGTSGTAAPNGTANSGGGAGGSGPSNACNTGGNGGSGIVVIRYKFQ